MLSAGTRAIEDLLRRVGGMRDRSEVLHALALAAGGREPLDRGLAALAAADPLLGPWSRRLGPDLASGAGLATVLRRHHLIGHAEVGAVERSSDLPATLRRIAAGSGPPPLWALAMRWLPVVLVLTMGAGVLLGASVMNLASGTAFSDIGMRLPLGYGSWTGLLLLAATILGTAAALAATLAIVAAIPGVRRLLHMWCPEVQRGLALGDLVRALSARREAAAWRHWRTWWFLTRLRLPREPRRIVLSEALLERRLVGLGVLPLRNGGVDWETSIELADLRLDAAVRNARMLVGPLLWAALLGGFIFGAATPMTSIIEQLDTFRATPEPGLIAIRLLRVTGILVGSLIVMHLKWTTLRPLLFLWQAPPGVTRQLAGVLAAAQRQGRDLGDALRSAAVGLPVPWSRAACRAGDAVAAGKTLPEALRSQGLLRRNTAGLGQAAVRLGGTAPQRWLDDLAKAPPGLDRLHASLTPAIATILLAGAILSFIAIFIVPKFEMICRDLAIAPDPHFEYLARFAAWQWLSLALILALLAGGWLLVTWSWRNMRRRAAAGLIASATAAGASETAIASALGVPAGDLAAICRACGWRARDRDGLLRALAAEAAAGEQRAAWLSVAVRIAVPLVLALPVWLIATGIFGTLIHILTALEQSG